MPDYDATGRGYQAGQDNDRRPAGPGHPRQGQMAQGDMNDLPGRQFSISRAEQHFARRRTSQGRQIAGHLVWFGRTNAEPDLGARQIQRPLPTSLCAALRRV